MSLKFCAGDRVRFRLNADHAEGTVARVELRRGGMLLWIDVEGGGQFRRRASFVEPLNPGDRRV